MKKLAVVAFGGNALLRGDEKGTVEEQERNAYDTCLSIIGLLEMDYNLIITHGNGPQVGNVILRNEAGNDKFKIPKMPIDVCVADTQGSIGYWIEKGMRNVLTEKKLRRNVVTIVSQVLVDKEDSAFKNPTKPVGSFYLKEEADLMNKANGWIFKEDPRKRGWRRVVPSPNPLDVLNKRVIKDLAKKGNIVVASGGGGIPVYKDESGALIGTEAVIDKDLASSLLANEIGADAFYIVTDVPKAFIKFNTPEQKALDTVKLSDAKKYYDEGEFPAGSMGPKIMAGIKFVENGGPEAIITNQKEIEKPNCGTRIIPD